MKAFEKWYLETWGSKSEDTDESNKAFCAWQACKKEVLKALDEDDDTSCSFKVLEKIRNL